MSEEDDDVDLEPALLDEDELEVLDAGAIANAVQSEAGVLRTSMTGMLKCIGGWLPWRPAAVPWRGGAPADAHARPADQHHRQHAPGCRASDYGVVSRTCTCALVVRALVKDIGEHSGTRLPRPLVDALRRFQMGHRRRNRNFRDGYIADPKKRSKKKQEGLKRSQDMVTVLESTIGAHILVCLATPNAGDAHDVAVVQNASLSGLVAATDLPRLVGLEVPRGVALARFKRATGAVRLGELSLLEQRTLVRLLLAQRLILRRSSGRLRRTSGSRGSSSRSAGTSRRGGLGLLVSFCPASVLFPYKRALPMTVHACLNARLLV